MEQLICKKCVLPNTFPGITFNEEGVCNHCQKFESFAATPEQKAEHRQKLIDLLGSYKDRDYQVMVAYSGGKDSTYTLHLFKNVYKAKVVAFTFDNGFLSPQAEKNIKLVCSRLGVDHMTVHNDQDVLNKMFVAGSTEDLYPMKTMERASTICTICSGFFKSVAMQLALDHRIPVIGYGWSPGQAPIQSALTQSNPKFVRMAQKNAKAPVAKIIGEEAADEFFLNDEMYDIPKEEWPYSAHPLAFEPYDENDIKKIIRELGWEDPKDVDTNSTNCMLNAYANQVHLDRYKFHPYAMEIANMVRQGTMSREEGMEKIYTEQNQVLVEFAKTKLDKTK